MCHCSNKEGSCHSIFKCSPISYCSHLSSGWWQYAFTATLCEHRERVSQMEAGREREGGSGVTRQQRHSFRLPVCSVAWRGLGACGETGGIEGYFLSAPIKPAQEDTFVGMYSHLHRQAYVICVHVSINTCMHTQTIADTYTSTQTYTHTPHHTTPHHTTPHHTTPHHTTRTRKHTHAHMQGSMHTQSQSPLPSLVAAHKWCYLEPRKKYRCI